MTLSAVEMLMRRMKTSNSLLCCGLDPDLSKFPDDPSLNELPDEKKINTFLQGVVDLTADTVCAYKVQKAFFDKFSFGHNMLKSIISYIHNRYPDIPVFIDCKIGDIDNTMIAYLDNLFSELQGDGIVVNPYMGDDVMKPMMQYPNKAIIVLVKTSNPGGAVIQDVPLKNGQLLWQYILKMTTDSWNKTGNMIPVISSTVGLDMSKIRSLIPDQMPILLAGVGAQGGTYNDLPKLLNSEKIGVFVNSSRGILYPQLEKGQTWREGIKLAAHKLKDELNKTRE